MNEQDLKLLLLDLSTRLPYGVKIYNETYKEPSIQTLRGLDGNVCIMEETYLETSYYTISRTKHHTGRIEYCKPYLRPMSSMTKEEKVYLARRHFYEGQSAYANVYIAAEVVDWMTEHHLDFRGLIKKGLALEAPEGMYNF